MTKDGDAIKELKQQIGAWDRGDFHDMRDALHATAVTVAVMQERQKAHGDTVDRTEVIVREIRDMVADHGGRLAVLESKVNDGEGIPSHQRHIVIVALIAAVGALSGAPKAAFEAIAELFKK